ncbi:hypothetical protein IK110_04345 [Candidatus Saccharibacteria bacterium]|nr:hypothetical protein [Candidatus Saccharibacteria bacterium]
MKFKLESGHRGLEGVATEGATGWDELGNLKYGNQSNDDEQSLHASLDKMNALINDLRNEGLIGEPDETSDTNNEEVARNSEDFERNEKNAEAINQEFGHTALMMAKKMSDLFSEEELNNMSLSELSATF